MDMIAVIGGTSESVFICKYLEDKYNLLVFAATEDGRRIMDDVRCDVNVGRLGYDGFVSALKNVRCVVDASHPFAVEVTATVKRVCMDINIPYVRFCRQTEVYDYENIVYVTDKEGAAEYLNSTEGKILFTTGAKTARFYENCVNEFNRRAVMRVMNSELSHAECNNMKCAVIYENPPFDIDDNINLIEKYGIKLMVSKDSGARGGVRQKAEACRICGIPLLLISAPEENGTDSKDAVLDFIKNIGG